MGDKPKSISFGLSGTSRRPGIRIASGSQPFNLIADDGVLDGAEISLKGPLVIPLPKEDYIALSPPKIPLEVSSTGRYDPNKIGLQVRSKRTAETRDVPTIPSFLRTSAPASNDEKERSTIEMDPDAYIKVPIGEFGAALMRGMGWKEGEGVGRNRVMVKPIEPKPRPKGLGLGADPLLIGRPSSLSSKDKDVPPSFAKTDLMLGIGSVVRISRGEHAGMTGIVKELLMLGATVMLSSSNTLVPVEISGLELITGQQELMSLETQSDKEKPPRSNSNWLHPHIRVRVASRTLLEGSVYQKSGDILDVHADEDGVVKAVVRLSDGKLISDVYQDQLEPIRPTVGSLTVVLHGSLQGERGTLLDINEDSCHIQLIDSLDVFSVQLDSLAAHL